MKIELDITDDDAASIENMIASMGQMIPGPGGVQVFQRTYPDVAAYMRECAVQQVKQARALYPSGRLAAVKQRLEAARAELAEVTVGVRSV